MAPSIDPFALPGDPSEQTSGPVAQRERALIIDDDPFLCDILEALLAQLDVDVVVAHTLAEGLIQAQHPSTALIFLDMLLPDGDGLDQLEPLQRSPGAPSVVVLTGAGEPEHAERALSHGAWDYIHKPLNARDVLQTARLALQHRRREAALARQASEGSTPTAGLLGECPAMRSCLEALRQAAEEDAPCLISGEPGTGRERFARALHEASARKRRPFVVVDCANIAPMLAACLLLGQNDHPECYLDHLPERSLPAGLDSLIRQGAQPSLLHQASGGTLFLDDVEGLPLQVQADLARCLRLHTATVPAEFRLVAATQHNLGRLSRQGLFDPGLYELLDCRHIALPPLRDRGGDIDLLARHFLHRACAELGLPEKLLARPAILALRAWPWPGNLNELLQTMHSAASTSGEADVITLAHLPPPLRQQALDHSEFPGLTGRGADPRPAPATADLTRAPATTSGQATTSEQFPDLSAVDRDLFQRDLFPAFHAARDQVTDALERLYCQRLLERTGGQVEEAQRLSGLSPTELDALLIKLRKGPGVSS
ncbi:sigma-54-dependent transcriptional regulator [Megalodesulfovibrio paquesii]